MARPLVVLVLVVIMIALIVGVDIAFFRDHVWGRLMVDLGIVLVFGAFYLRFLRPP